MMRRTRRADRLLDGTVVLLVAAALGLAASAPRAAHDTAWGDVTVVDSPLRAPCAASEPPLREACLATAAAIAKTL